ncbi:uncharacterized protein LOC144314204 isoform X2 [Canis aureus]
MIVLMSSMAWRLSGLTESHYNDRDGAWRSDTVQCHCQEQPGIKTLSSQRISCYNPSLRTVGLFWVLGCLRPGKEDAPGRTAAPQEAKVLVAKNSGRGKIK